MTLVDDLGAEVPEILPAGDVTAHLLLQFRRQRSGAP